MSEEIEARLEALDLEPEENTKATATLQRVSAELLDIAKLHQQELKILSDRFDAFITQAEADRAIMLQILQFLQNQYPGNGSG